MTIPSIIFSFVLENGEVISVKEHNSLKEAQGYVGFDIREAGENETCYYHVNTDSGSNLHTNATWVVNFKDSNPSIGNTLVLEALKILIRKKGISKILDYGNI